MVEVERIGVVSLAVVMGVLYAAIGLLVGLVFACAALVGVAGMAASLEEMTGMGVGGAVAAVLYAVCLPLFYAVIGFVGGAIIALLYNAVAGTVGGIKLQLSGADIAKAP